MSKKVLLTGATGLIGKEIIQPLKELGYEISALTIDENNPDNIMLELVGISAGKSRKMTINKYPHLYTTAYAEYDETPAKFLEKGYKNGKFYVGVGCHDNDSLVNLSKDSDKRKLHLEGMHRDYNINESNLKYSLQKYKEQTEEQKARVLREVEQMSYASCAHYSVLTWLHPFTWFGLGLTSRLNFGKPIALSYNALKDVNTAKEIIAHEFSHSQLGTIDGLAGKGIASEEFYERIRDAWVWTFLF